MNLAQGLQFFYRHRFRREITFALILKFSILTVIAVYCFSQPTADRLTREDCVKRIM